MPSGHSGLVTLSSAAHASLFSPCLLVADMRVWATSLLGVAIRHVICILVIFLFFRREEITSLPFPLKKDAEETGAPGE